MKPDHEAVARVERFFQDAKAGKLVVFTPCHRADQDLQGMWMTVPPDAAAFTISRSPHRPIRAHQAAGLITGLRRYAAKRGATPA